MILRSKIGCQAEHPCSVCKPAEQVVHRTRVGVRAARWLERESALERMGGTGKIANHLQRRAQIVESARAGRRELTHARVLRGCLRGPAVVWESRNRWQSCGWRPNARCARRERRSQLCSLARTVGCQLTGPWERSPASALPVWRLARPSGSRGRGLLRCSAAGADRLQARRVPAGYPTAGGPGERPVTGLCACALTRRCPILLDTASCCPASQPESSCDGLHALV